MLATVTPDPERHVGSQVEVRAVTGNNDRHGGGVLGSGAGVNAG